VWLIVRSGDEIVAISSYQYDPAKRAAIFNETYVFPDHRERGLFGHLFDLKYQLCVEAGAKLVKGLANGRSSGLFENRGWEMVSQRGKWKRFERVVLNG
jgi:N-acetylglutamate synthase-like GNAT family acetyltransferase